MLVQDNVASVAIGEEGIEDLVVLALVNGNVLTDAFVYLVSKLISLIRAKLSKFSIL
jgi:hypothetical protein